MDMEFTTGLMEAHLKVIGKIIKYQALVCTSGPTEEHLKDTGNKTTCTDKEYTNGLTVENTKEVIMKTENKVMVFTLTQMVDAIKVTGTMENSTEMESL
jgi:hypothetical protein